ncbi:MAG: hypothetical protein KUG65_12470 [Sphingomonadaceae bacterium]|nr:hypothetical protein [Sphingomonadaceae bacterium]
MAGKIFKAKSGAAKDAAKDGSKDGTKDGTDSSENEAEGFGGPSPNPKTNLILADVALRGASVVVREGLERGLLGKRYAPDKAKKILKGRSMADTMVSTAIVKLATRSVPGAILVGGGLLAKTLYDRRKDKAARSQDEAAPGSLNEDDEGQES